MREELQALLRRARKSQFYKTLPKNLSQKEIPVTTKEDLRKAYPNGFLAVPQKQTVSYHESTGTEGKPISSYFTENDWNDITSRFLRNAVSLTKNDVFFIKTPYAMVTTAHQAHRAANQVKALVIPADNRSSNMSYFRVIQLLADLKVNVTWSLPTEVLIWRIVLEKQKRNLSDFSSLRAFWVAGEPLSTGRKQAIKKLWGGKKVFEDYGCTETGSLAGECQQGRLHAWSDRILFEVYHPDSRRITPFGKGQLLVTPLFREAMPLLRYHIEDEVELLESSHCSCGSSFPVLQVLGRSSFVLCVGKSLFYPWVLEDAVFRAGAQESLILWKAYPTYNSLCIEYFGLKETKKQREKEMGEILSQQFQCKIKVIRKPLEDFIDSKKLFLAPLFNKPKFLFQKKQEAKQGIQYA